MIRRLSCLFPSGRNHARALAGPRLGLRLACRLALALGLLVGLVATPVSAQFSGPPTTGNPSNNLSATVTTDRSILYPAIHDLLLTPGDGISVKIFGQADYSNTVTIGTDGNVLLPLIGIVHVGDLSITQAEQLIAENLIEKGMYRDPQVTVLLASGPNAVITFVGELHAVLPLSGTRRLLDVVSTAGGLPPNASHILTIHRPGVAQPIIVDLGIDPLSSQLADIPVFAGDTIVISRIGTVYIVGSFKTPGTISLTPYAPLTLMQATALSGGIAQDAKVGDLRIIRTVGDRRTLIKLDIHDVVYGKAPDPILQPNDIVFLPSSALKSALYNGSIGTFLGVAGLIISLAYR